MVFLRQRGTGSADRPSEERATGSSGRTRAATGYVVALGLDAGREVGVFWDRMAVVVQRRELTGDFCVSGHQHRWKHCMMDRHTLSSELSDGREQGGGVPGVSTLW